MEGEEYTKVKENIDQVHDVLSNYKHLKIKYNKLATIYKNLKKKYLEVSGFAKRNELENFRLNMKAEMVEKLEQEVKLLQDEKTFLEEKYNNHFVSSMTTVQDLQNELKMIQELGAAADDVPEKELNIKNTTKISKCDVQKKVKNLESQISTLQATVAQKTERISMVENESKELKEVINHYRKQLQEIRESNCKLRTELEMCSKIKEQVEYNDILINYCVENVILKQMQEVPPLMSPIRDASDTDNGNFPDLSIIEELLNPPLILSPIKEISDIDSKNSSLLPSTINVDDTNSSILLSPAVELEKVDLLLSSQVSPEKAVPLKSKNKVKKVIFIKRRIVNRKRNLLKAKYKQKYRSVIKKKKRLKPKKDQYDENNILHFLKMLKKLNLNFTISDGISALTNSTGASLTNLDQFTAADSEMKNLTEIIERLNKYDTASGQKEQENTMCQNTANVSKEFSSETINQLAELVKQKIQSEQHFEIGSKNEAPIRISDDSDYSSIPNSECCFSTIESNSNDSFSFGGNYLFGQNCESLNIRNDIELLSSHAQLISDLFEIGIPNPENPIDLIHNEEYLTTNKINQESLKSVENPLSPKVKIHNVTVLNNPLQSSGNHIDLIHNEENLTINEINQESLENVDNSSKIKIHNVTILNNPLKPSTNHIDLMTTHTEFSPGNNNELLETLPFEIENVNNTDELLVDQPKKVPSSKKTHKLNPAIKKISQYTRKQKLILNRIRMMKKRTTPKVSPNAPQLSLDTDFNQIFDSSTELFNSPSSIDRIIEQEKNTNNLLLSDIADIKIVSCTDATEFCINNSSKDKAEFPISRNHNNVDSLSIHPSQEKLESNLLLGDVGTEGIDDLNDTKQLFVNQPKMDSCSDQANNTTEYLNNLSSSDCISKQEENSKIVLLSDVADITNIHSDNTEHLSVDNNTHGSGSPHLENHFDSIHDNTVSSVSSEGSLVSSLIEEIEDISNLNTQQSSVDCTTTVLPSNEIIKIKVNNIDTLDSPLSPDYLVEQEESPKSPLPSNIQIQNEIKSNTMEQLHVDHFEEVLSSDKIDTLKSKTVKKITANTKKRKSLMNRIKNVKRRRVFNMSHNTTQLSLDADLNQEFSNNTDYLDSPLSPECTIGTGQHSEINNDTRSITSQILDALDRCDNILISQNNVTNNDPPSIVIQQNVNEADIPIKKVKKIVSKTKNKNGNKALGCDLVSKILKEMDENHPAVPIDKKKNQPLNIDSKAWRQCLLKVAEILHTQDDITEDLDPDWFKEKSTQTKAWFPGNISKKCGLLLKNLNVAVKKNAKIDNDILAEYLQLPIDTVIELALRQLLRNSQFCGELIKDYYPAPPMTKIEFHLLNLLVKLQKRQSGYLDACLTKIELELFNKGCNVKSVSSIARFYTSICKLIGNVKRLRRFFCKAFLTTNIICVPILFTVLKSWPEVFPKQSECKNFPPSNVLVRSLHQKVINKNAGCNINILKRFLFDYYEYPIENLLPDDEYFKQIFDQYLEHPTPSTDFALRVFFRGQSVKYLFEKFDQFFKPLIYKIPSSNVNFKSVVILLIAKLCSQVILQINKEQLNDLTVWLTSLLEDCTSELLKNSINLCLGCISKKVVTGKKKNNKKRRN